MAKKKKKAAPKKRKKQLLRKRKKQLQKEKEKSCAKEKEKAALKKKKKLLKRRKREDSNTSIFQENFNLKFSFLIFFKKMKRGSAPFFYCFK